MKKLLIFITLLGSLSFIACNDELEMSEDSQKSIEAPPDYYQSYESALAIAQRQLNCCMPRTRSHTQRGVREHYVYSPSVSTRSTESAPVRFHVINFENEQGFAIVSADKRTTPVYAYSPTGNIDLEDAVQNSGVGVFMDNAIQYYRDEIEQFGGGPLTPLDPDSFLLDLMLQTPIVIDGIECVLRRDTIKDDKGPLLDTEWHQHWPYNLFCPTYIDTLGNTQNCVAGCGPIAMGQILAHHRYPTSHEGYNFNWDRICAPWDYSPNDTCKARLIRIIGLESNAIYSPTGTSTTIADMRTTFQQMGYSVSQVTNSGAAMTQNIKSNISANKPMYFRGTRNDINVGHAWVVDGYHYTKVTTTYYYAYFPYPKYKTDINETTYYNCNFGSGSGSGFYLNVYNNTYPNNIKYLHQITPNNN